MKMLARAVVTGFGMALGGALFRRISGKLGLEKEAYGTSPEQEKSDDEQAAAPSESA